MAFNTTAAGFSRGRIVAVLAVVGLAYVSQPYLTLWRLREALIHGDTATLERVIDWPSVREGLKEDIADGIIGMPQRELTARNILPPFGSGFVSSIAAHSLDAELTPQRLARAIASSGGDEAAASAAPQLEWAFFDRLTSFSVKLHCAGQEVDEPPLRLRLQLGIGGWRVVRAWVPQDVIERATADRA
jgi:hypothetical protein